MQSFGMEYLHATLYGLSGVLAITLLALLVKAAKKDKLCNNFSKQKTS